MQRLRQALLPMLLGLGFIFIMALPGGHAHAQDPISNLFGGESDTKEGEGDKDAEKGKDKAEASQTTIQFFPDSIVWPKKEEEGNVWKTFFDRQPRRFDQNTIKHLPTDFFELFGPLIASWQTDRWGTLRNSIAPTILVLLLILLFLWSDLQIQKFNKPLEERLKSLFPDFLDTLSGSLSRLSLIVLPAFLLQILASLGVAYFHAEDTNAARVLSNGLWYFLLYRLGLGMVRELLEGHWIDLEPESVRRLKRALIWVMRVGFVFQVLLLGIDRFMPALGDSGTSNVEGIMALVWFVFQIFLLIASGGLIWLKSEVLALLPEAGEEDLLWSQVRGRIDRHYRTVLGITMSLQVLWLVGFANAAYFLLTRGYALVVLLAFMAGLHARIGVWLAPKIATAKTEEEQEGLIRLNRGVRFSMGLLAIFVMFLLVGVWDYAEVLLKYRVLRIGDANLSLYGIGTGLVIFGLFLVISRVTRSLLMNRVYPRIGLEVGVGYAINTVTHYLLITIGALTALASLGVNLGALTLFATAFSVGIGFGLQDITRNLVSGFILLFGRSVKKGDFVKVDAHFGRVENLGARSVQIVTPDNTELVIPSSRLVSETIVNYTYTNPRIRIHVPVGVHYSSDMRLVEQALLNAALRHHAVLRSPRPAVRLMEFADSAVNFELLVWIDVRRIDPSKLQGELHFHIWDVFKEQDIEIPYPQHDLNLRTGDLVESIVRAMRKEPRVEKPAPTSPPPLETLESYLTTYEPRPTLFKGQDSLDSPLRMASFLAQREQEMQDTILDFFEANDKGSAAFAEAVHGYLRTLPLEGPQMEKLDELLNMPADRWTGSKEE